MSYELSAISYQLSAISDRLMAVGGFDTGWVTGYGWGRMITYRGPRRRRGRDVGDFRKLKVWQSAHRLALRLYQATDSFPPRETYGLVAQIRRSAASIPANLAEGSGRNSDGEFGRFVRISLGSAAELEYHLLLARDLGLLPVELHSSLETSVTEVKAMLASLDRRLRHHADSR